MSKWSIPALSLLVVTLSACHSNPYSGFSQNYSDKPQVQKPTMPELPIKADLVVNATEGATVTADVRGYVQTGEPNFSFEALPGWIGFDRGQLSITPPIGAASNPQFPNGQYTFTIWLKSSTDANEKYHRDMTIIVHRAAQALQVMQFEASAVLREGVTYSRTIKVQSNNYPVTLSGADLPDGLKINSTPDQSQFILSYTPPFTTVTLSNGDRFCYDSVTSQSVMCKSLNWTVTIVDHNGDATSIAAQWLVMDVRQQPKLKVSSNANVWVAGVSPATSLSSQLVIETEDPNGEVTPQVSVTQPAAGQAQVTTIASGSRTDSQLPFTMTQAVWTAIPIELRGSAQNLSVSACVNDNFGLPNMCTTLSVPVSLNI